MATKAQSEAAKAALVDWLCLSPEQRKALGLPQSLKAFSDAHPVGERTVRTWANDPAVLELVDARRAAVLESVSKDLDLAARPARQAAAAAEVSSVGESFEFVWAKLHQLIADGDKNAITTFMQSPLAKAYMESQLEQSKSDFSALTDAELVTRVLAVVEDEELAGELEARGWQVSRGGSE